MIRDDAQQYDAMDEEYPEFIMWLLEFLAEGSTRTMSLDIDLLPPYFQDIVFKEWETSVVTEKEIPRQWVDWTTKTNLENSRTINWWSDISSYSLYPLNTNADKHDKFNIISKLSINSSLRFIREKIKAIRNDQRKTKVCSDYRMNSLQPRWHYNNSNFMNAQLLNSQELSILILANILRQPIVLFSKTTISRQLGGIYIPINNTATNRKPLLMAYESCCFMPVIGVENLSPVQGNHYVNAIPLTSHDFKNLPIKSFGRIQDSLNMRYIKSGIWNIKEENQNLGILVAILGKREPSKTNIVSLPHSFVEIVPILNDQSLEWYPITTGARLALDSQNPASCTNTRTASLISTKWKLDEKATMTNLDTPINTFQTPHKSNVEKHINAPPSKTISMASVLVRCLAEGCENKITCKSSLPLCNECNDIRRFKFGIVKIRLAQNALQTHILKNVGFEDIYTH